MKLAALALLAVLPSLASASTYECSVKRLSKRSAAPRTIWSARISLDDTAPDARIFVVTNSTAGVLLAEIIKDAKDSAAIRAALRRYEGFPVVGLRKQAESLDLNLGHVEIANKKDAAPVDVDAWTSPDAPMLAATDVRAGLKASCRRRQ